MSDRIDHAAEARKCIEWATKWQIAAGSTAATENAHALIAQTHATLALVEQQKIANMIALMDSPRTATSVARVAERALAEGEPVVNRTLRPEIATALGIEVTP